MGRDTAAQLCLDCLTSSKYARKLKRKREGRVGVKQYCIFCGKEQEHIHHLDLDRQNNNSENLISVCYKCHRIIHYLILKFVLKKIIQKLKENRFTVIEISKIIGFSRQRIYKIIKNNQHEDNEPSPLSNRNRTHQSA